MCWNAEVSLITFITSISMCAYLWYRDGDSDRAVALWICAFSIMQFFEFMMWRNMKNHTIASKLSLVLILAQPLVLAGALLKYENSNLRWLLYAIIIISSIKIVYTIYFAFYVDHYKKWLSEIGEHCHLVWYFVKNENSMPFLTRINFLYYYPLLFACLCIKPLRMGLLYAAFGVITLKYSQYQYGLERGSIWCWIANALGILAICNKHIIFI